MFTLNSACMLIHLSWKHQCTITITPCIQSLPIKVQCMYMHAVCKHIQLHVHVATCTDTIKIQRDNTGKLNQLLQYLSMQLVHMHKHNIVKSFIMLCNSVMDNLIAHCSYMYIAITMLTFLMFIPFNKMSNLVANQLKCTMWMFTCLCLLTNMQGGIMNAFTIVRSSFNL